MSVQLVDWEESRSDDRYDKEWMSRGNKTHSSVADSQNVAPVKNVLGHSML